jgi:osmotically-inducible protein OsmY
VPGPAATGIDEDVDKTNDISAAIIDDLTFDPDVDASGITVEDRNGEAVLRGSVPNLTGVRSVTNAFQIRDDADPL